MICWYKGQTINLIKISPADNGGGLGDGGELIQPEPKIYCKWQKCFGAVEFFRVSPACFVVAGVSAFLSEL